VAAPQSVERMYKGEWFNSISHLIGAVAALVGLVLFGLVLGVTLGV